MYGTMSLFVMVMYQALPNSRPGLRWSTSNVHMFGSHLGVAAMVAVAGGLRRQWRACGVVRLWLGC